MSGFSYYVNNFEDENNAKFGSPGVYGESSSGEHTPMDSHPTGESRGKKKVGWSNLPRVEDVAEEEDEVEERGSNQEEELAEIHKTLSNTLPDYNKRKVFSPTLQADGQQSPSPPRSTRPRSALRSGALTPLPVGEDDLNTGVINLGYKKRSQTEAEVRARVLEDDISRDPSREPSPTRPVHSQARERRSSSKSSLFHLLDSPLDSGATTPTGELGDPGDYVPRPRHWRVGGLAALQMATRAWGSGHSRRNSFDEHNETLPYARRPASTLSRNTSTHSLADLVHSSIAIGGSVGRYETAGIAKARRPHVSRNSSDETLEYSSRPSHGRSPSATISRGIDKFGKNWKSSHREARARIEKHVKENLLRQKYLIKICRALMQYGAPTHRLEEYMKASARVLEVEAQFLYIPGCMIVSFDDSRTHTTEVRLVRTVQGIDLGRLRDTHDVYKEVVHDIIGVDEASDRLDEIMNRAPKYSLWFRVFMYGLASLSVGPFAFGARLIDLPIAFLLGCILGFLHLIVSNQNDLYSNLFELIAVLVTSFLARAFGSIQGGNLFCFAALAQSSIALILPGYIVLSGALELQAKSIVAGSVRLVYAIIYSLFIGFGLTLGISIYGVIDPNATTATTCQDPLSTQGYWIFFFVILFSICLMVINQAKYKQMPVMLFIAFVGYLVNYFSSVRFAGNAQISSALGALSIAFMANVYSRIGLKLDEPAARFMAYCESCFAHNKKNKVSEKSSEPSTPSYLEHQIENDEMKTETSRWMHRLTHLGRAPPTKTHPSRSNSHTSLASIGTQDSSNTFLGDTSTAAESQSENATSEGKEKKKTKAVRVHYSLAAAAMLPAIFVQVPSGLAVSGSLVQALATGEQITKNSTGGTLSAGDVYAGTYTSKPSDSISFTVGYSVLEVAIGLAVGLYLGTLIVYPTGKGGKLLGGKMRSGLFSF